jgi:hypothetical protein
MLNYNRKQMINTFVSIRAMCWPIQFLGPEENGIKLKGFDLAPFKLFPNHL